MTKEAILAGKKKKRVARKTRGAPRVRARGAHAKTSVQADGRELTQGQVDELLDNLYEIYTKLDTLDPVSMTKEQNEEWTEQYTAVTDAIRVLRNRQLASINTQLDTSGAKIAAAIDAAENALHGVQNKAKVLAAVGSVLKTIASIAALV